MAEDRYLQAHRLAERHPTAILSVFGLLLAVAFAGMLSLRLDMSFRPLFASGAAIERSTLEFEGVFGQSSGAWIAAILENESMDRAKFFAELAHMSVRAAELQGIGEVLSLSTLKVPVWHEGTLAFATPVPKLFFNEDNHEFLDRQVDELLKDGRLVNWLMSADGNRLLLAARLDAPMQALDERREVIHAFEDIITSETPPGMKVYFTGVSIVELGYERQVLRDQLIATALTTITLLILLYWTFGNVAAVMVCMLPVSVAIPATLGIMGWLGSPVTIINTAIPAVILAIGVADAVHMLTAWLDARVAGADKRGATDAMLQKTGKACFFTTITTMAGFAALMTANLLAVGTFGLAVAIGILTAWLANQLLLPWMLRRFDLPVGNLDGLVNRLADRSVAAAARVATLRPGTVVIAGFLFAAACAVLIPRLQIDQRFNEELPASHPVSVGQTVFEENFGGFLGPDIGIRKRDGTTMLDDATQAALERFVAALDELPETRQTWSVADLLTGNLPPGTREVAISTMREMPELSQRVAELIDESQTRLAVLVRIGDIGTLQAADYRARVVALVEEHWSDEYEVDIVGQWWLAQYGMRLLLRDMLAGLATAMLIVMPLLWLAIRERRLFLVAAVTNVLPLLIPLAFMVLCGITLRIGTAVVLAVALGIVVDNTIHMIVSMQGKATGNVDARENVTLAMRSTGRAVVFTTLALAGAFLSMLGNQLHAVRDMGLVAAVTISGAMLADLLFLPAFYLITRRRDA